MSVTGLPVWAVESASIAVARTACGDERTMDAGRQFLPESTMQRLAERHSNQISSMLATRMGSPAHD